MNIGWEPIKGNKLDEKFISWIKSINNGPFVNRINFEPFNKYCEQAEEWLKDDLFKSDNRDHIVAIMTREKDRIDENSYYFFARYVYVKDGDAPGGAWGPNTRENFDVQKFLCFLFDTGLCYMIGKGRQIGSTSVILPCAMKRTIVKPGYSVKFVCESDEKTEEIFVDKLKFPFYNLPAWLKPNVLNDRGYRLRFAKSVSKGDVVGLLSGTDVVGPTRTAVNGGSPNLTLIDEIGEIPILGEILEEGLPTLYVFDQEKQKWVWKRQVIMWGTAGKNSAETNVYEERLRGYFNMFNEGDFSSGIIPIVLDFTAKHKVKPSDYEAMKKVFLTSQSEGEREKSLINFMQKNPRGIDDMFLRNEQTILPIENILANIDRIRAKKDKTVYGRFEPHIMNKKLVGATFIPAGDDELFKSPIGIIEHPVPHWKYRYYQGTDPIVGVSGHSKMASAIFDAQKNSIPAFMNWRTEDYKQCYLQSMCLGIYYDYRIRELPEYNVGHEYITMHDDYGVHHTLIYASQLPDYLKLRAADVQVGINKKAANAEMIMNKLSEVVTSYADNIDVEEFFIQLKTFVKKMTKTGYKWEPKTRYDWDDLLDAVTYAYIARLCYGYQLPIAPQEMENKQVVKKYGYDENWRLVLRDQMVPVKKNNRK